MRINRFASISDAVNFLTSRGVNVNSKVVILAGSIPSLRMLGAIDFLKRFGYTVSR